MPAVRLTEETLRTLSVVEADESVVVSLYVDLDPATASSRDTKIASLLSALEEERRRDGLSDDAREALAADRERLEAYLRDELDPSDAAGIAIFSASALDVFEVVKLADPVDAGVHVDQRPFLEPVLGHEDEGKWCVLLVTRETGRIFRGGPTGIREIRELSSDVKNQHKAGGSSQGRFERSVEQEVEWHLERVTEALFRHFRRRPFEHLIVSANNDALRPALEGETHSYLLERVRGWVDVDEQAASEDEVFAAVRDVMDRHLAEQERDLLARLAAELGRDDGRAAEGVKDVLAALVEGRVETLLMREGASAEGVKCVTCGWLGVPGYVDCPVDETRLDPVDNVVDAAIQTAIQQSADVHVVRAPADPEQDDGAPFAAPLAALLRF
jgi:peptide chain release factor subunit 1